MRKPNSTTQNPSIIRTIGLRHLLVVVLPVAFSIGCSQLQQPTSFKPMPQPKSLTQRQQRPVDQILDRQDAIRLAEQQAAAEAEALAAEAEAANANIDQDETLESQQQEIVAEAAERANALQPMETQFQVAQVSFESEIEPDSESETEPKTDTETEDETPSATETVDAGVKLIANADDMEGVPVNFARDDVDFSTANFLRPSSSTTAQTPDEDMANVAGNAATPFGDAQSLSLPLQPMLFNPLTRAKKSILEGTLRPMQTTAEEIEPEVEVTKAAEEPLFSAEAFEPRTAFNPLAPLRSEPATIKLETSATETDTATASRLLTPSERKVANEFQPPTIQPAAVEMVEATTIETPTAPEVETTNFAPEQVADSPEPTVDPTIESSVPVVQASEPIIVSEQIVVVDPVTESTPEPETDSTMEIAVAPISPLVPMSQPERTSPSQPFVDESLSRVSASYLIPKTQEQTEEAQIPVVPIEVFEDAIIVAADMERELTAAAIPSETIEQDNDFKVQAASNTTITSVCSGCGSDTCKGCEYDDIDNGEPMFTNNDFAAPETPGGDFVAPMAVPPATVPDTSPKEIVPASSDFGKPVTLDPPPESDAAVTRIAALPISTVSNLPVASASKVPPVGLSTLMELNAVTWKSRLDEAIDLAETRLNRINNPSDSSVVNLRLLKAVRSQMEQVDVVSSNGEEFEYTKSESQYWQHQLEAITTMLGSPVGLNQDNQAVTDYHRHQTAHETLEHLRSAVAQLESIANLKVTSGHFCTEITGFGQFRTFPSNTFSAGQKMLVYCEVENYTTTEQQTATGNDFRTRLRGSFAIYDADGKVVQQAEFPTVDDVARKRRRDFYMYLPSRLAICRPASTFCTHSLRTLAETRRRRSIRL